MKMNGNEVLFHPFYSQSAYVGILPGGPNNFCKKSTTNFFWIVLFCFPAFCEIKLLGFFSTLTCYIYLVKLILFILCKLLDRSDHCAGK